MSRILLIAVLIAVGVLGGAARANCLNDAATFHRVDPVLLQSIAQHESGMKADALNVNKDGSQDIGLMQINSIHLRRLARYGITRDQLFDPCVNAYVGAWILRENIDRLGPTWKAVGAYNAASPDKQYAYVKRIYAMWSRLQRSSGQ
ncbi:lytic transglycosylase [Cupriavidus sp. UYMMa02A]|nr:lytic transglycosylase [Cupriavidus sp. UYMMa02A]